MSLIMEVLTENDDWVNLNKIWRIDVFIIRPWLKLDSTSVCNKESEVDLLK